MLEFQLFRVKRPLPKALPLLDINESPPPPDKEIIAQILASTPSAEFRRGTIWHVGNIQSFKEIGVYFRIGKVRKSTLEIFKDGQFLDMAFETAPYTHAFLDTHQEIVAIARKPILSPSVAVIANQLIRLIHEAPMAKELGLKLEIGELSDPTDFIEHLKTAFAITRFRVFFTRPNPFDADKDFIKPLQHLLGEADGDKGKTELNGHHLNPDTLEKVARSTASTGDDAVAWLRIESSEKTIQKHLKGNPVTVTTENVDDNESKINLFKRIREIYRRIRGQGNTE